MNINETYVIRVDVNNSIYTYTAKIIAEDSNFITFIDKNGQEWTYNKNKILSFAKVEK